MKNTIFISDLHLSSLEPEAANLFFSFLKNLENSTDTEKLYILGDLFKFWVGDDDKSEFNNKIKLSLNILSKKIPIYLMPGNRDFTIGKVFAKESNSILIPDPYKINLYGKNTILTHGDMLCTKDIKHNIFRSFTRIPFGLNIFLKLNLNFRIWIATKIQRYSAKSKIKKNKLIMLPQEKAINNLLKKYNSTQLIHGHTHIIEYTNTRISLGECTKSKFNYLIYYSDNTYKYAEII